MILSIMTFSIKGLYVKLSISFSRINPTQHNNTLPLYWVYLCSFSCFIYYFAECHYAECLYAQCCHAVCHYAECLNAQCCHAVCHYAECLLCSMLLRRVSLCWVSWRLNTSLQHFLVLICIFLCLLCSFGPA